MKYRILLISDIHGNLPALEAISSYFDSSFDYIINCGDSLVYAPFPNETLAWLSANKAISILGNTDRKVIKLLRGKSFKKPGKTEKRVMYTSTAEAIAKTSEKFLNDLKTKAKLKLHLPRKKKPIKKIQIGIYHGSPSDPDEFLFCDTPALRFHELAAETKNNIIITGHSHSPYHRIHGGTHFINPGSVGRMFDGDPRASCAVLEITPTSITVTHRRIPYDIEQTVKELDQQGLPAIYGIMFRQGRKLN